MLGLSLRRRVLQNASRPAVQQLETRQFLDAVAWNLGNGSLIQNWENAGLISVNDNWSGVPSIEGYFQTNSAATNRDPQTILVDTGATLDVNANQTSGGFATGGVTEVQLATPVAGSGNGTVAMQGSGTAADPFLKLYLSNSGQTTPVRIKYDLIDIDATGGGVATSQQSFALQYRLSTTGDYVNVPAGYILNAADFAAGNAGQTTNFDVTLPADTIGAAVVQVRIVTTNSAGTDQLVAVDNIRVFGKDVFAFSPVTYNVVENVGTLSLTVKRLGDLNGTASVNYALTNGTASAPGDFTAGSGTLTFGDQVDTQTISVTIVNDSTSESTEQFTAVLSSPSAGFGLGSDSTATITINDDDAALPDVVLNEIKSNPASTDTGAEYVELRGTASASLANVYFVSLEGDGAAAAGLADVVVNLSSASLGTSGYLLIGSTSLTAPSGTTLVTDPVFATVNGILENGSNSFALIYSLTAITSGSDLDTNGDGTLDLPPGAVLIDAVGTLDGGSGDVAYGAILTQPNGQFHAASRFPTDTTPLSAAAWYNGDLVDPSLNGASETGVYDPRATNSAANLPQGAVLTPGTANYPTGVNAGAFVLIPVSQSANESVGSVTINVYRAGGAVGAASVTIGASGGSATSGNDYTAFTQTLNFADGEYLKSITINITDDADAEAAETIDVQLSNPVGASILREGLGRVTINLSDATAPSGLLLNEIDVNPPGTDDPFEFVELRGAAGTTLLNVYLLSIEGSGASAGTLDAIVNLSGAVIGSNGLLMIKSTTGGFTPLDAATGVFGSTLFDSAGAGLEGDSNTFMIIFVPIGISAPNQGSDLDTTNSGTLSLDPAIVVLDGVASMDPDAGDIGYGGAILAPFSATASDAADALVRFPTNGNASDATAWYYGNLDTAGNLQTQVNFGASVSSNFPVGGVLTPGARNAPSGDAIAPTVLGSVFVVNPASGSQQSVTVTFSEDVGASLAAGDFQLVNTDTNAVVPLTLASVSGGGTVASLTFSGTGNSLGASILLDGHYRIRVLAGQVADAANNTLAANSDTTFAFKNADFDGDLDVDFDNLLTLAQNYGGSGKTFADGDANYDGLVNFDDLLALAQRYGTSLFSATTITRSNTRSSSSRGNVDVIN